MKGLFKKLVVGATSFAMVASMGTAFAQTEMSFAGYDVSDPQNPTKVLNEKIDGKYTGKQVREAVKPEDIEWVFEGYEDAYPHAGYSRLYLEGQPQDVTAYNNLYPQWETRRVDKTWETAYPYSIYEQQQTKIGNTTWTFDYGNPLFGIDDDDLITKTSRKATVTNIEMKEYGFGAFDKDGNALEPSEVDMYKDFGVDEALTKWNELTAGLLSQDSLSARDANNLYVVEDEEIAGEIPVVYSKYITAKFNADPRDTKGLETKDVAADYLANGGVYSRAWRDWDADTLALLYNDLSQEDLDRQLAILAVLPEQPSDWAEEEIDYSIIANGEVAPEIGYYRYPVVNNVNHVGKRVDYTPAVVDIAWSEPIYEDAEPYKYFQYLIINGVQMDGDINDNDIPDADEKEYVVNGVAVDTEVYRYTGGIATPVVEWKFERFDKDNVEVLDPSMAFDPIYNAKYPVIENKYLDGRKIDGAERRRTGAYGMVYAEVNGAQIDYYIVDNEGNKADFGVDTTPRTGNVRGTIVDGEYVTDKKSGSDDNTDKTGGLVDPTYIY